MTLPSFALRDIVGVYIDAQGHVDMSHGYKSIVVITPRQISPSLDTLNDPLGERGMWHIVHSIFVLRERETSDRGVRVARRNEVCNFDIEMRELPNSALNSHRIAPEMPNAIQNVYRDEIYHHMGI